ncbi:purine nucleoside phosphorylase YfiH [Pantoea sp. KPR_PJ]|uniref:purine nucleoside phosphorylase YfiH n=1 Tax=Pantoea sp. KPR_PJ TaxID=2738375 RepID=UPI0035299C6E
MNLILPEWPAPVNVRACSTLRCGGISVPPWDALNLGGHVGDNPAHVATNRQRLVVEAGLPQMPRWLDQVHGTDVVRLPAAQAGILQADAAITSDPGIVCAVMTADCLPVLFCSADGKEVAAAHAGWRGLCAGVLENTLAQFSAPVSQIHAWLGPAIGPDAFEVGSEVRSAFMATDTRAQQAFRPAGGKYFADIWLLAQQRLQAAGVNSVSVSRRCTFHESGEFFSFRRDGTTGRMASLIWLG